jgi:cellulose synthase/poly-beta-1,6-N-acetylglucosamine synthase-like glycosyltransferase
MGNGEGLQQGNSLPAVAAVIIGRNEGERLRACLNSVLGMNYPRELIEVIYVDSSSTDSSVGLAKHLGVKTVVLDGPTTAARGRNAGWTETEAPLVLFLDGDTVLDRDFVAKAVAQFAEKPGCSQIAGVYGNRRETKTSDSIYNAIFDLEWNAQPGWSLFFGGDALVRREALAAVGGYNPLLIAGEEPDMCRRIRGLGHKILHIDEPMTLHDLAMHRLGQYWRRSIRTGYAYAEVSAIYAKTDDPLWSAESRSNAIRGMFWMGAPVVAVVLSVALHTAAPIGLFLLTAVALCGRTAAKARSKTSDLKLLLAYSLHSHLQQIPIFLGQLRYWISRTRGQKSGIIEYKTAG